MMLLVEERNIAFFRGFVESFGYWGVAGLGLFPSLCFCLYVKWDDHRQAKAHADHGAGPAGHGAHAPAPAAHGATPPAPGH